MHNSTFDKKAGGFMDPTLVFSGILTTPFWILVTIIGVLVAGFRWIIENIAKGVAIYFPDKYEPWWEWLWREGILPAAPLVVGGLIGYFVVQYPYPDPFASSDMARLFVGVFAGLMAAFCYPRIMYYLKKLSLKWNVEAKKVEAQLKEEETE
jgi:hypothetical protein